MSDLMREEFEIAFIQKQVDQFGEGFRDTAVQMLKREGDFENTPTHYELERRRLGLYDAYWVEMLWWAWQASRETLVIEMPKPAGLGRMSSDMTMQEIREDNRFNRALDLSVKAIHAAGVKTK